ncbi:MAG: oligosaccharide flippase family protein [Anaerolineales bacterium]
MNDRTSDAEPSGRSSLARDAIRSSLWTGLSQYWLFGLGLIKTVVLARLVPPEWFGVVALAQAWVSYLTLLRFDFRPAVLASDEEPMLLSVQFWLENITALTGFLLAGALWWFAPGLLSPPLWAAIIVLLSAALFTGLTSTPMYMTEKHLRQDVIGRLTIFQSLLGLGVASVLAWRGYYLPALLMDAIMPALVIGAGVAALTRWRPRLVWDRQTARELFSFAFTMWTAALLGKIIFQLDDWLVGNIDRTRSRVWLSSGVLPEAYYSRAYVAGKMPMDVFAGMLSLIALPLYSRSAAAGRDTLLRAYRMATWLLAYMISFSSAFALIATEEVITIILGENWLPTVPLFRLMSLFIIMRPLFQNASQLLVAIRREKLMRQATFVQAVFIVVFCAPAVWFWGAAGAAVVVSLMTLVGMVFAERYVSAELGERIWPLYLRPLVTGLLTLAVLALIAPVLPANLWVSAGLKGAFCIVSFGTAIILTDRDNASRVWSFVRQARAHG